LNLMEELGIECLVGHPAQIRAAEPRKQKHDRRDADLILKLLAETAFQRSGCLPRSCRICGLCCGIVIRGYACGRESKMPCSPLLWRMDYDEARPCGVRTDKAGSHCCRSRPIPPIGGVSCKQCTRSSKRRSRN
jgi:hypothetical protein